MEVELVQLEQTAILRCLVQHHGLKQVLAEGLTPWGLSNYKEIVAALRDMDEDIAALRKSRAQVKGNAPAIDQEIDEMVRDHRRRLLEYGAAVQLVMDRQFEVLPLDDGDLLEQAKSVTPDGRVQFDPAKIEARHDGQVKAALASGACGFIILGGRHNLSASVRRLGKGTTEYIRVTTKRYRQAADEK